MTHATPPDNTHDAETAPPSDRQAQSWTSDDRQYEVTQHVAALMDIMGQTECLLRVGNPLDGGRRAAVPKCEVAWREAAAPVWQLRRNFEGHLNACLRAASHPAQGATPLWQTFGDSVVVGLPAGGNGAFLLLTRALLIACADTVRAALDAHVPLQCAVELGWASTNLFEDELYGPLLAEAHALQKKAKYPRVVVGDRLYRLLVELANGRVEGTGENTNALGLQAAGCLRLLDEWDGAHIVDYLGPSFNQEVGRYRTSEDTDSAVAWLIEEQDRFSRLGNSYVAHKYARLILYYGSRGKKLDASPISP